MRVFSLFGFLRAVLPLTARTPVSLRILLGVTDADAVRWGGTIQAQGGRITSLEPWRFEGTDAIVGNTWHLSTHTARLFAGTTPVSTRGANPFVPNGLIVNLSDPDSNATYGIGPREIPLIDRA